MQLTHEQATHAEVTPYLQSMAHPVPVLSIYGCCSKLEPNPAPGKAGCMPSPQAVYYGWMDALLAVALDTTFPEDTLFCIFEEDWRLDGSHTTIERLLREATRPAPGEASGDRSRSPVPGSSSDRRPAAGRNEVGRSAAEPAASVAQEGRRFQAPKEQIPANRTPQWLTDMVSWANIAHKHHVGDVIWYTWSPGTGRHTQLRPAHASTSIFVTRKAALRLREHMGHIEAWHLDVLLRRMLLAEQSMEGGLRSSWVWPAVGSHAAHLSGCDDKVGERQSTFDTHFSQSGTRVLNDMRGEHRLLYTWSNAREREAEQRVCHLQGPWARTSPWWRTWHADAKCRNTEVDNGRVKERQACVAEHVDRYTPVVGSAGLTEQAKPLVLHEADGPPSKGRQKRNWRKTVNAYMNHRVFTYSEVGTQKHGMAPAVAATRTVFTACWRAGAGVLPRRPESLPPGRARWRAETRQSTTQTRRQPARIVACIGQADADCRSYEQAVRLSTDQAPDALRGFRLQPNRPLSQALAPPAFGEDPQEPGSVIRRFLSNEQYLPTGGQLGEYYAV